jgi:hypothetical protein
MLLKKIKEDIKFFHYWLIQEINLMQINGRLILCFINSIDYDDFIQI